VSDRTSSPETQSVDEAMNRVLLAEREARAVVEQCRAEAVRIVTAAEDRARSLANRTDQRVKMARRIAERRVEKALLELRDSTLLLKEQRGKSELGERLERALEALANEVIGAEE
jgi:hypothetical protein